MIFDFDTAPDAAFMRARALCGTVVPFSESTLWRKTAEGKGMATYLSAITHSSEDDAACRNALTTAGWDVVVLAMDAVRLEKAAERLSAELKTVEAIRPFFSDWLAQHRAQYASGGDAAYWAARAWVNRRFEGRQRSDDEDLPLARMHQEALMLADLYRRHGTTHAD